MQVYIAERGLFAFLSLEGMQALLSHHRQRVRDAPQSAFKVWHAIAAAPDQNAVISRRRWCVGGEIGTRHGVGPLR